MPGFPTHRRRSASNAEATTSNGGARCHVRISLGIPAYLEWPGSAARRLMTTELPHSGTLVAAPTVESVINRARTKPATTTDLFYTATLALESLTTSLTSVRSATSQGPASLPRFNHVRERLRCLILDVCLARSGRGAASSASDSARETASA